MITMVLGGLWHGASWTFAVWGFYHGLLLIIYHAFKFQWDRQAISLQRFITFISVCFGWVFFRATSFTEASQWFSNLFGFKGLGLAQQKYDLTNLCFLLGIGLIIANSKLTASNFEAFDRLTRFQRVALGGLAAFAILFMNYSSRFLYFQF